MELKAGKTPRSLPLSHRSFDGDIINEMYKACIVEKDGDKEDMIINRPFCGSILTYMTVKSSCGLVKWQISRWSTCGISIVFTLCYTCRGRAGKCTFCRSLTLCVISGSLGQLITLRGRLPEDLSLHYQLQVLAALEYLAKKKVAHLDIKGMLDKVKLNVTSLYLQQLTPYLNISWA